MADEVFLEARRISTAVWCRRCLAMSRPVRWATSTACGVISYEEMESDEVRRREIEVAIKVIRYTK